MTKLLRVDGTSSEQCNETSMLSEDFLETTHLEEWIVANPQVIDESLKVVTTQFSKWASKEDSAAERPDIIALSNSGDLVVIELKRKIDKTVHLQALTYAALASSFTMDLLAEEHAKWLNKRNDVHPPVSVEQARLDLESFIDTDQDNNDQVLFALPKIVLVAPEFAGQVLTTVQWLSEVAPDLLIECHEFRIFNASPNHNSKNLVVSFSRVFPLENLDDRRLRAQSSRVTVAKEQRRTRSRNAVVRILEQGTIPDKSSIKFDAAGQVNKDSNNALEAWLDSEPERRGFTWDADSAKPLIWDIEPDKRWSPSGLRNELFSRADADPGNFAATLAWFYNGENLHQVAPLDTDEPSD